MTLPVPSADVVIAQSVAAGVTVGLAESLTGGLVGATLTAVPGSSAVLRGGLVVYATDLKATLLGVDADLLARVGPVDPVVALAMARGAARVTGADIGASCTGVAGPGPADGHPAGTVYVATWDSRQQGSPGSVRQLALSGDRGQVRAGTVEEVLAALLACLQAGTTGESIG